MFVLLDQVTMSMDTQCQRDDVHKIEDYVHDEPKDEIGGLCALMACLWSCCSKSLPSTPRMESTATFSTEPSLNGNSRALDASYTDDHDDDVVSKLSPKTLSGALTVCFGGTLRFLEDPRIEIKGTSSDSIPTSKPKDILREIHQISPDDTRCDIKIVISPNGYVSVLNELGLRIDDDCLLFVGNITARKGWTEKAVVPIHSPSYSSSPSPSSPSPSSPPFEAVHVHRICVDRSIEPSISTTKSPRAPIGCAHSSFPDHTVYAMAATPMIITVALNEDRSSLLVRDLMRSLYGAPTEIMNECLSFCRLSFWCQLIRHEETCGDGQQWCGCKRFAVFVSLHVQDSSM